ncbi:MAG: hypothetical protein AB1393_12070 [Candidatus Edwardsbacteria bacterium]
MKLKLQKIRKENAEFEKRAPYNFCDRWCERCPPETTNRCKVYQDEFARELKHIASGKDPYDWDVVLEDVKENFEKTRELIQKWAEEKDIDLSQIDDDQYEKQRKREEQLFSHPLYKLVMKYSQQTNQFIKDTFYEGVEPELIDDYETIIWYHTLLPAKVHRLLCDLYAKEDEEGIGFYDAVAQIDISKKSIAQSEKTLKKLLIEKIAHRYRISELLDLLCEITNQVKVIEDKMESWE